MNKATLTSGFGLACATCVALTLWFSYKTGCAGDLKGGTVGDMQLALRYDSAAGAFLVLVLVLGVATTATLSRISSRFGFPSALCIVPATIAVWLVGWQLQDWGVQSCFPR